MGSSDSTATILAWGRWYFPKENFFNRLRLEYSYSREYKLPDASSLTEKLSNDFRQLRFHLPIIQIAIFYISSVSYKSKLKAFFIFYLITK